MEPVILSALLGNYTLSSSSTFSNIEGIFLMDVPGGFNNGAQTLVIEDGATFTGLKNVAGFTSASGTPDDNIEIFGDRDLLRRWPIKYKCFGTKER